MFRTMIALILAVAILPAPCGAQAALSVRAPAGWAPMQAPCVAQADGSCSPVSPTNPLPAATAGRQEVLQLVAGNTPAAPATAYGGDYVFAQICSGYGTITLQVRGPDGATWQTVVSATSSDAGGGTAVTIGSAATVRSTVTGTTGCTASLSRVPR